MTGPALSRLTTRSLRFGAVGAASSLGLAWVVALFAPLEWGTSRSVAVQEPDGTFVGWHRWDHWPVASQVSVDGLNVLRVEPERVLVQWGWAGEKWIDRASPFHIPGAPVPDDIYASRTWAMFGFPLRCVATAADTYHFGCEVGDAGGERYIPLWRGECAWAFGGEARLPVGVLWKGLLVNAAAHGACWWALVGAVRREVHRERRRRGLCPRCAYDLRGLPTGAACPECGNGAPPPA